MSIRSSQLIAFALFLFACLPAFAQQAIVPVFAPNPAPPGANVRMTYVIFDRPGCGEVVSTSVSRSGTAVRVDYVLGLPVGTVCIGVPPPGTFIVLDLGGFPPGAYTVSAFGTDPVSQANLPAVSGGFIVIAGSNVPAIAPRNALWLALLAVLAGGIALRRRTAR